MDMKKYRIIYQKQGEVITSVVDQNELEEIETLYTVIQYKEIKKRTLQIANKIDKNEIIELFNEIEMILRSNLTLNEAITIVLKSMKKSTLKTMLISIQSALKNGQPIYDILQRYEKQLDPIIIAFFRIFHFKGNTHLIISALCDVLNTKKSNKELIVSNMSYPLLIFTSFLFAMSIIFYFVIPKFEHIFIQYNLSLPFYTSSLLSIKAFFFNHLGLLLTIISLIYLLFKYVNSSKEGRRIVDEFCIRRIPIVSKIYMYYEMYNLFLGLRVLSQSHYEFNVALENSLLLLKNKYLLDRIQNLYRHIQGGMSIYEAFLRVDIFDELVLNLINSAEMSSNMNEALEKIEAYYKEKFTKSIKRFSSLIEPIFFVVMMLLILWVMLAIFTPIWNMSEMINL